MHLTTYLCKSDSSLDNSKRSRVSLSLFARTSSLFCSKYLKKFLNNNELVSDLSIIAIQNVAARKVLLEFAFFWRSMIAQQA